MGCAQTQKLVVAGKERLITQTHVLLLFPVVAVGLVPSVIPRKRDGCDSSQRDTLVSRSEEHVKVRDPGLSEDLGVGVRSGIEERAGVQQARVEEVGRHTTLSLALELGIQSIGALNTEARGGKGDTLPAPRLLAPAHSGSSFPARLTGRT